jgi:hypothetical protein
MMVHPDSHRVSRAPWYLGNIAEDRYAVAYEAITLYGRPFQASFASVRFCNFCFNRWVEDDAPTTPSQLTPA